MSNSYKVATGASVGPFVLGCCLYEVISIIQSSPDVYRNVDFKYSEMNPLNFDFSIDIRSIGIRLQFDSRTQKLKLILIYNPLSLDLNELNVPICSPKLSPTIRTIIDTFGPANIYEISNEVCELRYPGIVFSFKGKSNRRESVSNNLLRENNTINNNQLFEKDGVVLSRIYIFRGDDWRNPIILHSPPIRDSKNRRGSFSVKGESVSSKQIRFEQGISSVSERVQENGKENFKGMRMMSENGHEKDFPEIQFVHLIVSNNNIEFALLKKSLHFGIDLQDVLAVLGEPEGIFIKHKDKMKIFKERSMPNDEEEVEEEEEEDELGNNPNHDYFLNYYKHGIDMLIDGKTHTLKKLILHTNFPGHDDFSLYRKCQFQLEVPTETELKRLDDEENVPEQERVGDLLGIPEFAPCKTTKKRSKRIFQEKVLVRPDLKWGEVQLLIGKTLSSPIVVESNCGSTRLYGYHNYIFEILKNDHIASITILEDE